MLVGLGTFVRAPPTLERGAGEVGPLPARAGAPRDAVAAVPDPLRDVLAVLVARERALAVGRHVADLQAVELPLLAEQTQSVFLVGVEPGIELLRLEVGGEFHISVIDHGSSRVSG